MRKKVILSGVKPTGAPHIGNYFGAMRQMVELQDQHPEAEKLFMVADYHALNFIQDGQELQKLIYDLTVDYLAIGLDPEKSVIFQQSAVPAHTELTWMLDAITTMPYLMRAHAYKDAEAKGKEVTVGTFNYPMLMASDIILYDTNIVPVGADQKQHVEYARDAAEKFNRLFGETFVLPEAVILDSVATVPGIDGRKMSKSYGNTIPLFAEEAEVRSLVMRIPTDSRSADDEKDPEAMPLYQIHKLFDGSKELKDRYAKGMSYKDAKEQLISDILQFTEPLRQKRAEIAANREYVLGVLKAGGEKARAIAEAKMEKARNAVGVKLY